MLIKLEFWKISTWHLQMADSTGYAVGWVGVRVGGDVSMDNNSNRIETSWLLLDLFHFYWLTRPRLSNHSSTDQPIYLPIAGDSTDHQSSNRIWIILIRSRFYSMFSNLIWCHPVIQPSTHQPLHPPIGRGISTNHKSSSRIELYW